MVVAIRTRRILNIVLVFLSFFISFSFSSSSSSSNSIWLKWNGGYCNNSKSDVFQFGACSFASSSKLIKTGLWDNGTKTFIDPISPGSELMAVHISLHGWFTCNESFPNDAIALLRMTEALIGWSRLPETGSGCFCGPGGFNSSNSASYALMVDLIHSPDLADAYNYGGVNSLTIQVISNSICLLGINLTLISTPPLILKSVKPERCPVGDVGCQVLVTGSGFGRNGTTWCRFGNLSSSIVSATILDDQHLECLSPIVEDPHPVDLRLSDNGQVWSSSSLLFIYYQPKEPSFWLFDSWPHNWWIFLVGSAVLLALVSSVAFAFVWRSIRRQKKKSQNETSRLLSEKPKVVSSIKPAPARGVILPNDLKMLHVIGHGSYGDVYKGIWQGTPVAVKILKLSAQTGRGSIDDFTREANIMKRLAHPNIVQFLGAYELSSDEVGLVCEFVSKGSLSNALHDSNLSLSWETRLQILIEVSRGVHYLHSSDPVIIHRDLKSQNVLIDDSFSAKVCDFGLARLISSHVSSMHSQLTSCGTPSWTAPEVLRSEPYTTSADIFSLGILIWEVATREEPHQGMPVFQIVFVVGTQGLRPTIPASCPLVIADLTRDCWNENPAQRPSSLQVIQRLESFKESLEH